MGANIAHAAPAEGRGRRPGRCETEADTYARPPRAVTDPTTKVERFLCQSSFSPTAGAARALGHSSGDGRRGGRGEWGWDAAERCCSAAEGGRVLRIAAQVEGQGSRLYRAGILKRGILEAIIAHRATQSKLVLRSVQEVLKRVNRRRKGGER
jgi:hypothetical protein